MKTRLFRVAAELLEQGHEGPGDYGLSFILSARSDREDEGLGGHPSVRAWDRLVLRNPHPWLLYVRLPNAGPRDPDDPTPMYEGPGGVTRPAPLSHWWWWLDLIVDGRLPRPEIAGESEEEPQP